MTGVKSRVKRSRPKFRMIKCSKQSRDTARKRTKCIIVWTFVLVGKGSETFSKNTIDYILLTKVRDFNYFNMIYR